MSSRPTLTIFLGGLDTTQVERVVAVARRASALDSIEAALSTAAFDRAILATNAPLPEAHIPGLTIHVDEGDFHFGSSLVALIEQHALNTAVYLGGGGLAYVVELNGRSSQQTRQMARPKEQLG